MEYRVIDTKRPIDRNAKVKRWDGWVTCPHCCHLIVVSDEDDEAQCTVCGLVIGRIEPPPTRPDESQSLEQSIMNMLARD